MSRVSPSLLPRISRLLEGFGSNLKLARLRRKYSSEAVAQRAGISRKTLSRVEQGDPAVAIGIYARVMQVLRLEDDLGKLGVDDLLGRKLQDANLTPKRRAPKRSKAAALRDEASDNLKELP
jgi:transcriptional regulator with XRE-family HTH domain